MSRRFEQVTRLNCKKRGDRWNCQVTQLRGGKNTFELRRRDADQEIFIQILGSPIPNYYIDNLKSFDITLEDDGFLTCTADKTLLDCH